MIILSLRSSKQLKSCLPKKDKTMKAKVRLNSDSILKQVYKVFIEKLLKKNSKMLKPFNVLSAMPSKRSSFR